METFEPRTRAPAAGWQRGPPAPCSPAGNGVAGEGRAGDPEAEAVPGIRGDTSCWQVNGLGAAKATLAFPRESAGVRGQSLRNQRSGVKWIIL